MSNNVDIILPNYNSSKTLNSTINSILNQSYRNWKLIIVDDNSDYKTKKNVWVEYNYTHTFIETLQNYKS